MSSFFFTKDRSILQKFSLSHSPLLLQCSNSVSGYVRQVGEICETTYHKKERDYRMREMIFSIFSENLLSVSLFSLAEYP